MVMRLINTYILCVFSGHAHIIEAESSSRNQNYINTRNNAIVLHFSGRSAGTTPKKMSFVGPRCISPQGSLCKYTVCVSACGVACSYAARTIVYTRRCNARAILL